MKIKLFILLLLLAVQGYAQQPIPVPAQSKSILLVGGTAHIGNGMVIPNSAIGFKNGKITFVGEASKADKSAFQEIVDVTGKQIYPGFICPNSTLGLMEIESVRATRDMSDVGTYNPNLRSLIAYNTDNKINPTVRSNGVLIAQITPQGGFISGSSSIVMLEGWNWEDAVLKSDDGVHMNWPSVYGRQGEDGNVEKNKNYDKQKADMGKFFADAKAYNEADVKEEKNLRFEAMKGLFTGTQTLFIHADNIKEISEAIYFAKGMSVKKMALVGGTDSWMLTDLLKENNIGVILARVHNLPRRAEDDVDLPYKTPYLLQKAGVLFCLNTEGDMSEIHTRNLPFYAGTAVAYGLTKEEAVACISYNAAKILGIDNRTGTLETGKDATLFISTGDALDMRSNNVERAYITGRNIDLNNEQKALYETYKKKYGF